MSQVFPFLALPYDVRRGIYMFALGYPDLDPIFTRMGAQCSAVEDEHERTRLPACALPTPHVPASLKTTPGIMLCNRQTAMEAREVMQSKTFTLKRPPPQTHTLARPMDITEFISEDTLKGVRRVHFIMDLAGPRGWLKTMETLLDVWSVDTHLQRIDITLVQPDHLPLGQFWETGFGRYAVRMLSMVRIWLQQSISNTYLSGEGRIDINLGSKLCQGSWH